MESRAWVTVLALIAAGTPAATALANADKSAYTLADPTPRALMRELSADRPDTTESPYTVDAGHVQIEMSLVEYARDDEDDVETDLTAIAPFNLKLGLLNDVDLQLVIDPYLHVDVRDDDAGTDDTSSGFGNVQVRLKVNLWGNDGGDTALAIMPFVQFPTADDELGPDDLEGGFIVPLAIALGERLGLGLMIEADFVTDGAGGYDVELVHTAVLGFDLIDRTAAFVEYVGIEPIDGDGGYAASAGGGVTYLLVQDVQLDIGAYVGLTDDADDFRAFTGMTVRL